MRMIFGAIGGMKFGRGNRSTRRKPTPAPLCPPQNPTWQPRSQTPDRSGGKPATNRLSYGAAFAYLIKHRDNFTFTQNNKSWLSGLYCIYYWNEVTSLSVGDVYHYVITVKLLWGTVMKMDIKRKTCDIRTWGKKIISRHIVHQHWYTSHRFTTASKPAA
jgi:hypothetical protein